MNNGNKIIIILVATLGLVGLLFYIAGTKVKDLQVKQKGESSSSEAERYYDQSELYEGDVTTYIEALKATVDCRKTFYPSDAEFFKDPKEFCEQTELRDRDGNIITSLELPNGEEVKTDIDCRSSLFKATLPGTTEEKYIEIGILRTPLRHTDKLFPKTDRIIKICLNDAASDVMLTDAIKRVKNSLTLTAAVVGEAAGLVRDVKLTLTNGEPFPLKVVHYSCSLFDKITIEGKGVNRHQGVSCTDSEPMMLSIPANGSQEISLQVKKSSNKEHQASFTLDSSIALEVTDIDDDERVKRFRDLARVKLKSAVIEL